MAIYLQVGKKDEIKGNVSAKGHENWIECDSFQFGIGRAVPMFVGKQTQREASLPSLSEVTMSKTMDDSSAYLFQEALIGSGKPVTIHITKTGDTKAESVVEYVLGDAMISSYSLSSGGDQPSESISFAYTKIEMKYIQWDETHKKSSQINAMYDLGQATGKA